MFFRVRWGFKTFAPAIALAGLLASATLSSHAQADREPQVRLENNPAPVAFESTPDTPAGADARTEKVVREIDDPATGNQWLLERDLKNPAGPGRLVLSATGKASLSPPSDSVRPAARGSAPALPDLIRTGDRLVLEEHTRLVDATLEAVAMGPARPGGALRVRLAIGGRVVSAIAVAPGRVMLSPDLGEEP